MIELQYHETCSPDFSGFNFYVEAGDAFDADAYTEAYSINRADIDEQSIKAAQDAAARLNPGRWLAVSHEEQA